MVRNSKDGLVHVDVPDVPRDHDGEKVSDFISCMGNTPVGGCLGDFIFSNKPDLIENPLDELGSEMTGT